MSHSQLKIIREERGWSQAKVADALGVSTRTISRWEQGQSTPYPYYQEQLSQLFNKSLNELGFATEDDSEAAGMRERIAGPLQDPAISLLRSQGELLVGREALVQKIKKRLHRTEKPVQIALQGLPGAGKTSLVAAIVNDPEVQQLFPDGVLWASLGIQPNMRSLLSRWGSLSGVGAGDVGDVKDRVSWSRALHKAIGSKRLLLIIDDAWSAEEALAFCVGGSGCAHILTTRQPQIAYTFARHHVLVVPELSDTDAVALLAHAIPQLVEQQPQTALELVHMVGGLPLALTLIGSYLASQALPGQPQRVQRALMQLRDREKRLQCSQPVTFKEHALYFSTYTPRSLQAAIEVSDRWLSQQARDAFAALAVFPAKLNSFSEESAVVVSQQPVEVLDQLWDAGLLESCGEGRYTLHQTIVDYASSKRDMEAQLRFIAYFITFVEKYEKEFERLALEVHNILAAFNGAILLERKESLLKGILSFFPFMQAHGLHEQAEIYLRQALLNAQEMQDDLRRRRVLDYLSACTTLQQDYMHDRLSYP